MKCDKEENLKDCPCTYEGCPRKGICCSCLRYHLEKSQFPACFFSSEAESSFDRSLEAFLKDVERGENPFNSE